MLGRPRPLVWLPETDFAGRQLVLCFGGMEPAVIAVEQPLDEEMLHMSTLFIQHVSTNYRLGVAQAYCNTWQTQIHSDRHLPPVITYDMLRGSKLSSIADDGRDSS